MHTLPPISFISDIIFSLLSRASLVSINSCVVIASWCCIFSTEAPDPSTEPSPIPLSPLTERGVEVTIPVPEDACVPDEDPVTGLWWTCAWVWILVPLDLLFSSANNASASSSVEWAKWNKAWWTRKYQVCFMTVAHTEGALSGFCGMKSLGVFLHPLDGMLVHCSVTHQH